MVDFWAAWCGPCKMVAPEMEKLAAKYDGVVDVVKVDVDANPRLSQAFGIMSIPTIAYFKPGAQPQGVVGFRPLEQLEQAFALGSVEAPARDQHRHRGPRAERVRVTATHATPAAGRGRSDSGPVPGRVRHDLADEGRRTTPAERRWALTGAGCADRAKLGP